MTMQMTQPLALSAHTLIGDVIRNKQNEEIGRVEEIMIDIHTGRVAYVVMSEGGFLGLGDRLFAVPWTALEVDTARRCLILDADKKLLENAPGFDKNHWPEMPSGQWYHEVYRYYNQKPYWQS